MSSATRSVETTSLALQTVSESSSNGSQETVVKPVSFCVVCGEPARGIQDVCEMCEVLSGPKPIRLLH